MSVHLYTLTWNEADMLGFFFRHYDPWVDRYVVYDDGSTDATVERLMAHPRVEVRRFERVVGSSFVESHQHMHDTCWKESRGEADWVVITAIDEHLHVPGTPMREYLARQRQRGVTYTPALGFQMISEEFPSADEQLSESRTMGAPFAAMNKLSVFDPSAVTETNFAMGRHSARPQGRLRLPDRDELLLLHYKYLGFERAHQRHLILQTGLGEGDRAKRLGVHYGWSRDTLRADWDAVASHAVDLADPRTNPELVHRAIRWWRAPLQHRAAHLWKRLRDRF